MASALWITPASGQLTDRDIAALQERARQVGWTFAVGKNGATDRSLDQLCGLVVPQGWEQGARFDPCTPRGELPPTFDWCGLGGCTPIKDQGACGSCWAFATVGALESAIKIADGIEEDLSEQWLVSCNTHGWGCDGGYIAHGYHTWRTDPCGDTGSVNEADFPYTALESPCNCPYAHEHLLESWAYIGTDSSVPSVEAIKQAILDYGPASVGVYVDEAFQGYTGGVFNACATASGVNHAVVLVGWDDTQGTSGVWILRNSWGPAWGEGGYMRIEYGCSLVGHGAAYVDYPGYDPMDVTPHRGWLITGDPGGPFAPTCASYMLTNVGTGPLDWAATKTTTWLDVSPSGGVLPPLDETTVEVCIAPDITGLPVGVHADVVTFTNTTTGFTRDRDVAAWLGSLFDVPIDPAQSMLTVQLCYSGVCDTDTSPISGPWSLQLDDFDNPSTISLFDFEMAFVNDLNLNLSFGILGAFNGTFVGLVARHAEPGTPFGPNPVEADQFVFSNLAQDLSGVVNYTSWGLPCFALQDAGLPCDGTMDLAGTRPDNSTFDGTITTNDRTATLVLQVQQEIQLQGVATFTSDGTIRGDNLVPAPTPGDVDRDGGIDLEDWAAWPGCVTGPATRPYVGGCGAFDFDSDLDIDLSDSAGFQNAFAGGREPEERQSGMR
jgi:hypothetical protein